jgi:gamma-glutamylcyclotransferase (GGCT)/AIG2-like uncharacterized protein YtfP
MLPTPLNGNTVYFAYGANLCRDHMALWCPGAVPLFRAWLPDHRLVFRTWVDLTPSPGDAVPGALYEMKPEDLAALDAMKDVPSLYASGRSRVTTDMGPFEALVYRMIPGRPLALPDEDYLNLLLQGYEDWGLDASWLTQLQPRRLVP